MSIEKIGQPTLQLRAESWECDFNGHMNARFYCRAFQAAAEVAEALAGNRELFSAPPHRLIRFHRELLAGDGAEIFSFSLPDSSLRSVTAHYLVHSGNVAATALDYNAMSNGHLPVLYLPETHLALPRSLTRDRIHDRSPNEFSDYISELGPVCNGDLDPKGNLCFESSIARLATGSLHHLASLGFTQEYTRQTSVARMVVELRYVPLGACKIGDCLRLASRILAVERKTWTSEHLLYTMEGVPIAAFEKCVLAVNIDSRKSTTVPDFISTALS